MTFVPPIVAPIVAPIATPGGVVPWYLLGGVTAAQCVAAYQPKGAADLAVSYVNLNNPGTNDAAPGTAPTFAAATGWTFNGSSQYLSTGHVPTSLPGYSILIRFTNMPNVSGGTAIGMYDTAAPTGFLLIQPQTGAIRCFNGGAVAQFIDNAPTLAAGVYGVSGLIPYRNGIAEANTITTSTASSPNQPIYIGALNINGSPNQYCSIKLQALAIYNITLSPTQVGLIAAAMAAL